jgi:hypothetical protein
MRVTDNRPPICERQASSSFAAVRSHGFGSDGKTTEKRKSAAVSANHIPTPMQKHSVSNFFRTFNVVLFIFHADSKRQ